MRLSKRLDGSTNVVHLGAVMPVKGHMATCYQCHDPLQWSFVSGTTEGALELLREHLRTAHDTETSGESGVTFA